MRLRGIGEPGRRVLVVVCDKGEEAVGAVCAAMTEHGILGGQVTAVGGFQRAELAYYERDRLDYVRIPVTDQVEVLSMLGDVAERDGTPQLHTHAVLGRRDGSTVGGHLLSGDVWPTLEVIVTEVGPELAKRVDPETGLALLGP
jgi:predicted DNA-binding protein with PD1-like motif